MSITPNNKQISLFNTTVIVAALGYFVDIFDTVLYGMVRVQSLKSLGLQNDSIERVGMLIDNWQLLGLMLGGILWGVLGDKLGRLKVLYGSIALYSIASIGSGLIQDANSYAILRFIAGIGLAGELGAGITLVNELLSKEKRGLATAFVAVIGILGAVCAGILVKALDNWRLVYIIGGVMGIILLVARFSVRESTLYLKAKKESTKLGDFFLIFKNRQLFIRYISLIFLCLPLGYIVQLYAKFSPELALSMGMTNTLNHKMATNSMMLVYFGMGLGDIYSGLLSNKLKSRKRVIRLFLIGLVISIPLFWMLAFTSYFAYYTFIVVLGFMIGYWAVSMSLTTESYGTNLRATVTTTVPNFLRGLIILVNLWFMYLSNQLNWGPKNAMIFMGVIIISISFIALRYLPETYGKNLDYTEK